VEEEAGEPAEERLDPVETEIAPDLEPEPEPEATPTPVLSSGPAQRELVSRLEPEGPLLRNADSYRDRWTNIQIGFVDEPFYAVESAGRLLSEVLGELASTFASKRNELESQWRHGGDNSTEELRQAFRAYRSFFNRVVST
jgi:hypothetical protein